MKFRNDQERQVWGMVYAAMLSHLAGFSDRQDELYPNSNDYSYENADEGALSWADGAVRKMRARQSDPAKDKVTP